MWPWDVPSLLCFHLYELLKAAKWSKAKKKHFKVWVQSMRELMATITLICYQHRWRTAQPSVAVFVRCPQKKISYKTDQEKKKRSSTDTRTHTYLQKHKCVRMFSETHRGKVWAAAAWKAGPCQSYVEIFLLPLNPKPWHSLTTCKNNQRIWSTEQTAFQLADRIDLTSVCQFECLVCLNLRSLWHHGNYIPGDKWGGGGG